MSHARLYVSQNLEEALLPSEVLTQDADSEHFIFDVFGIGEARTLGERAYIRPVIRETRDFLLQFSSITVEAQNALLKLFEEPPLHSVFHVVIEREDLLIPTLRSRLILVRENKTFTVQEEIGAFLKLSYGERMVEIANRTKKKDVAWITAIGSGAEMYVESDMVKKDIEVLSDVVFVRQYLGVRGSSSKMLLEELALSLPLQK